MAEPKATPKAPAILAVTCVRSVSFNSALDSRWPASKFAIERDANGDVTILAPSGRQLFIPKQLAILELE